MSKNFWFSAFMAVSTVAEAGGAPVEASFVKVDADREVLVYKVKINTDKPLKQVDMKFHYLDADGKELSAAPFSWQNNIKGKIEPIQKGRSYENADPTLPEHTAKCTIDITMIHFVDGSKWTPGK
ncbi:MAG: hypothetical protein EXR72_02685 [Myxococcales bacterium]|nr:hypothetical protein [Myxococcales bacterium]